MSGTILDTARSYAQDFDWHYVGKRLRRQLHPDDVALILDQIGVSEHVVVSMALQEARDAVIERVRAIVSGLTADPTVIRASTEAIRTEFDAMLGPPEIGEAVRTDLQRCARCGQDHAGLWFHRMRHSMRDPERRVDWSHWAECPVTHDPVMLAVEVVETDDMPRPTPWLMPKVVRAEQKPPPTEGA